VDQNSIRPLALLW